MGLLADHSLSEPRVHFVRLVAITAGSAAGTGGSAPPVRQPLWDYPPLRGTFVLKQS